MQRLIVVYNPRSSQAAKVEAEVLAPARQLKGWTVGKYAVRPTNVDDNAARLAKILRAGDLVVTAGGDATATIGVNGVMQSGLAVTLAVLGYGNFNDHARTWQSGENLAEIVRKFESGATRKLYPLEILMDGEHWRWAACYFTIGMFAESTRVFDEPKVRKRLQKKKCRMVFSMMELAKWYFKRRKQEFIPAGKVNGRQLEAGTTDLMMINSPRVAKMMRGGEYYLEKERFWLGRGRLANFGRLGWFMGRSVLRKIPGEMVKKVKIEFNEGGEVVVQAEGESERMGARKIEIKKNKKFIQIV